MSPIWPDSVYKLAKAISVSEGFGQDGAVPTIANNPGDLTGVDGGSFATVGVANTEGVLKFVNVADGWQALYIKTDRMLRGKSHIYHLTDTLEQVGRKYSGGDENWAVNVAKFLGVPVTTTLAELAGDHQIMHDPDLAI